jgi:hypothetical protein
MSYCRFHNTSIDLRDCVDVMQESESLQDLDLSSEELSRLKYMRQLANDFLEECERLLDPADEE